MSSETCILEPGKESFTLLDILKLVASYKGLKYQEGEKRAHSETFATYVLDSKLLEYLSKLGIKGEERPDLRYEMFTLVDENPQQPAPGFRASNYWNFKL